MLASEGELIFVALKVDPAIYTSKVESELGAWSSMIRKVGSSNIKVVLLW